MVAPCQGCERRTVHPNCHATCQEYLAYNLERQQIRAKHHQVVEEGNARKEQIQRMIKLSHKPRR